VTPKKENVEAENPMDESLKAESETEGNKESDNNDE
jgi:hypothetical protein